MQDAKKVNLQAIKKTLITTGIVAAAVAAVGFALFAWYNATHLRVSATRPDGKIGASSTNIIFWYNKPIDPSMVKNFSITPKVSGETTVSGTALIFSPDNALDYNKTYTATISSATSKDGKYHRGASKITFKVDFIPADKLPKDVLQRGIEKQTDNQPTTLAVNGTNALINQGVTSAQVNALQDTLNKYFQTIPVKKDYNAQLGPITADPYDPNSNNPSQTYHFDMTMNKTKYSVKLACAVLGDIHVYVYSEQGAQVYDSGNITVQNDAD